MIWVNTLLTSSLFCMALCKILQVTVTCNAFCICDVTGGMDSIQAYHERRRNNCLNTLSVSIIYFDIMTNEKLFWYLNEMNNIYCVNCVKTLLKNLI